MRSECTVASSDRWNNPSNWLENNIERTKRLFPAAATIGRNKLMAIRVVNTAMVEYDIQPGLQY